MKTAALDLAAREWLEKNRTADEEDARQARLHEVASKYIGLLAGGDEQRSENARNMVQRRIASNIADNARIGTGAILTRY